MSQYLILLALIPLSCFELVKLFKCRYKNTICGFFTGLVIAPVSFACINFTYVPIIGKFMGLIGLFIHLAHFWFGYLCVIGMDIVEPGAEVTALQFTLISGINGVVFAAVYAVIGCIVDIRRRNTIFTRKIFPKLLY
ncbi:MAG: hypothetical protein LJE64_06375 [Desulfofustis sp.]|jgi:hypothetical protein|nr:hypothetical protein [Desulfofustis sp.]